MNKNRDKIIQKAMERIIKREFRKQLRKTIRDFPNGSAWKEWEQMWKDKKFLV